MYYISIESFTGYSTHSMNILFTPSVLAFTFLSSCVSNSPPEQRKPQPLLHWKGLWHSFLMPCPDDFAKVHHLPSPPWAQALVTGNLAVVPRIMLWKWTSSWLLFQSPPLATRFMVFSPTHKFFRWGEKCIYRLRLPCLTPPSSLYSFYRTVL